MDVPISLMGSLMNLYLGRNWTHTKPLTVVTSRERDWNKGLGRRHLCVFTLHIAALLDFLKKYRVPITFTILKKQLEKENGMNCFKGKWSGCK